MHQEQEETGVPGRTRGREAEFVLLEDVEVDGVRIGLVTLNRPHDHNPVNEPMIAALEQLLTELVASGRYRAIVLTGSGPSFSSGGDLKGYDVLFRNRGRFEQFVHAFQRVCLLLERSPVLTVAMVNGTCVAGGMELALSCDLITVADDAVLGDGHMKYSQMPGSGCQRLVRAIGLQRAKYWLLSGDTHPAEVAVEIGLAIGSAPREQLREFTFGEVQRICSASQDALGRLKSLIVTAATTPLDDGLAIEAEVAIDYATTSPDALEGILAFAEKRAPRFDSDGRSEAP